jgi:hypothetical protein
MNAGNTTVEERIVEMRIDNEKFEAGAKRTINILESLDRSLKGLGEENATGLDTIEQSLDKVTNRFSAMGIVGDQVMRSLTNKAIELVGQIKNLSTMLTSQQVGAGWNKYASKVEAVQTIMASTNNLVGDGLKWADQQAQLEGVTEQLERLTWFADETSYSFTDMVNNVGKFTAAGRELEESVTAMQGISAWAAISGGKPAEAGRAMYNLSQALGIGAVTAQDWKSIELANMATHEFKQQVIEVAEEMGTLHKVAEDTWEVANPTTKNADTIVTVENFRNALAQKWFNSDVLLEVLNRYGDFAQFVADVQEDFGYNSATNVLQDLKDYEESLKKAGKSEEFLKEKSKELGVSMEVLRDTFNEMLRPEYDLGRRAFQAAQEAKTFTEAIEATKDAVSTKWMDVFELLFGNYLEAKELWTKMAEVFWDIFAQPVDHLIEIIKGSQGFFSENGIVAGFAGGMQKAAGGTAVLEDRLAAVGKTMDDFRKALNKTMGAKQVKQIIDDYGSLEEALKNGAITVDQFKLALGALDDTYDSSGPISLSRALNKAGKTVHDFENALRDAMDPKEVVRALQSYESLEDAFRNGAISVEDFKAALNSLGIDSENVEAEIEETVSAGVGNIAEMRELALEVLRGEHGDGNVRLAWYESMGLDPELMQAMVGDLKHLARATIDDDYLMEIMESYYQAQHLSERLGYATYAEYLASLTGSTEEFVYDMNSFADEADNIYASIFGEGVLSESGELISAGDLFRKSITNLLEALDKFGETFDKAFLRVFGRGDEYDDQIATMSDGFFTLTAAFYSFSEKIKAISESEGFLNFATAFFSVLRVIGKTIGFVFKVARKLLSFVFKLLSPILKLVTGVFDVIATGIDTLRTSFDSLGIVEKFDDLGNTLYKKIKEPIDKINHVIDTLISSFKYGFENGGIAEGLKNMGQAFDQLFENHPVFLTVIHALAKAFLFLKDVISGLVLVVGSIFGGAVLFIIGAFQKIGEWFGKFITWAENSEFMVDVWTAITNAFKTFGDTVARVYEHFEKGYAENGFVGGLTAIADSFERGVKRIVPGGEKIIEIFDTIKDAIKGVFKKKTVDENGVEQEIDQTENSLLKLEETFEGQNGLFSSVIRGYFGDKEAKLEVEEGTAGLVESAWQGFLKGLRELKISDVIDALKLGVIADVLFKVGHSLNIVNGLADNIADVPDRLTDMFEDFGQMFRSLSFDIKANAVLKFAVAAGLIAGAIWILAKVPSDKLEKASSTVIAILSLLAMFANILVKSSGPIFESFKFMPILGTGLIGMASVISSIGITALILALVAKYVGVGYLREAAKTVIEILGVITVMFAGIIFLVKSSDFGAFQIRALGSMFMKMGAGMMLIALAVQMLILPILAFCGVLKLARGKAGMKKFGLAVGTVVALLLTIGVMVWLISQAVNGFTADQIHQIGTFLIKVAASLMIIALAFNMLTMPILLLSAAEKIFEFNIDGVFAAITVLGIIAGLISLLLVAFAGTMSNKAEAQIKAVGTLLIKFAASLLLISFGFSLMLKPIVGIAKLCEQMSDWHIIKSLGIIVVMIGLLAGILALIGKVVLKNNGSENALRLGEGLYKIAKGIMMLSLAGLFLAPVVLALAVAFGLFSNYLGNLSDADWKIFEKGFKRLANLSGAVAKFAGALLLFGMAAVLTGAGIISLTAGILMLSVGLAIVSLAFPKMIDVLEKLKSMDLKSMGMSMGKVLLILSGLIIALVMFTYGINRLYHLLGGSVFSRLGDRFVETLKKMANGMKNGVSNGFTKMIEFLKDEENKKSLLAALETLVIIGAGYVSGLIPTFAHVIIGGVIDLVNAVAKEINDQAPGIVEAFTNLVHAAVRVTAGLLDSAFNTEFFTKLTETEEGVSKVTGHIERLGIAVGILKLARPFSMAKTTIARKGGLVDAIVNVAETIESIKTGNILNIKESFGEVKAAVQLLVEAITGGAGAAGGGLLASLGSILPWLLAIAAAAAAVWFVAKRIKEYKKEAQIEDEERNTKFFGKKDPTVEERADELKNVQEQYETAIAKRKEFEDAMKEAENNKDNDAWVAASESYAAAAQEIATMESDRNVIMKQFAKDLADETHGAYGSWKDIRDELEASDYDVTKVTAYQRAHLDDVSAVADDIADIQQQMIEVANTKFGDEAIWETAQLQERLDALNALYADLIAKQQIETDVTKDGTEATDDAAKAASSLNNSLNSSEREEGFDLKRRLSTQSVTDAVEEQTDAVDEQVETITEQTGAVQEVTAAVDEETNAVSKLFGVISDVAGVDLGGNGSLLDALDFLDMDEARGWLSTFLDTYGIDSSWLDQISDVDLKDVGKNIIAGLTGGINSPEEQAELESVLGKYSDYIPGTLKRLLKIESPSVVMADEVGRYIPAGIGKGIDENWYQAVNPLYRLMDEMRAAGVHIVDGLIKGVTENMVNAYLVGQNLAASFDDGFRERLDIHSPSGVMYDNAYNTVLGTVNGYNDAVKANLLGTNSMTDSVVDVLYDKSKKLLLPFKAIMFGFNTRIKKTRKEIFDGLDTDIEGYLTAFGRLTQKKEEIDQQINSLPENNYDERDRLHVIQAQYDTLADILYGEFANALGLTTDEFYRQLDAAQGNIYEMERMKQLLGDVTTEARSFGSIDTSMPVDTASSSATDMYENVVDPFEQIDKVFNDYGVDAAYGLVYGILAQLYAVYESGGDLAAALQSGFTDTLLIESPSRVFKKLAGYIPLGIQQGIQDETGSAIDSVVVLGNELIDAIMNSMLMVSTVADEEFEFSPSITPVVDLNNVNAAAGAIGSAFGGNYSMSAEMTNAISRRMNDVERIASNVGSTQTVNNGDNIVFNIYGAEGQDPNAIADAVMVRMANRLTRRGAAFG